MSNTLRILGIDPGSRLSGFGVVDCEGSSTRYVGSGAIRSVDGDFPARLQTIFEAISELMQQYQPDVVAVESVFVHRNASSALKLGHARAAAICATFAGNVEVAEYAPREIKQAVAATGAATKEQVQAMVKRLLQLDGEPSADAADALALCLCHAHQMELQARLNRDAQRAANQ